MSSKDFRKISHQELEKSLYLSNFSKEISKLTDWQTYKKFRIIWNLCINIPGMSTKKFQKDISTRTKDIKQFSQLLTDTQTHRHTHGRTWVNVELTPPEVGQLLSYELVINSSWDWCELWQLIAYFQKSKFLLIFKIANFYYLTCN